MSSLLSVLLNKMLKERVYVQVEEMDGAHERVMQSNCYESDLSPSPLLLYSLAVETLRKKI